MSLVIKKTNEDQKKGMKRKFLTISHFEAYIHEALSTQDLTIRQVNQIVGITGLSENTTSFQFLIELNYPLLAVKFLDKYAEKFDPKRYQDVFFRISIMKPSEETLLLIESLINHEIGNIDYITKTNRHTPLRKFIVLHMNNPTTNLIIRNIAELLIQNGANINHRDKQGLSILNLMTRQSSTKIEIDNLKFLLERGADPNLESENGLLPLHLACNYANTYSSLEAVELLLSYGADFTRINDQKYSPLDMACEFSHSLSRIEVVETLLDAGADADGDDTESKYTPLVNAACNTAKTSSLETCRLLLDRGAEIDHLTREDQSSALMYAAQASHGKSTLETVTFLIDHGAQVNLQNPKTLQTPIHYSARDQNTSHVDTLKLLVSRGADLTIQDKEGRTPLVIALVSNDSSLPAIQYLWETSPPEVFQIKTKNGNLPQDIILQEEHKKKLIVIADAYVQNLLKNQQFPKLDFTNTICTICRDHLDMKTATLRCQHKFHIKCLNDFLTQSDTHDCPNCRTPC